MCHSRPVKENEREEWKSGKREEGEGKTIILVDTTNLA